MRLQTALMAVVLPAPFGPSSPKNAPSGTTILLTTHYLEEAEALCEEIALISGGGIVARSTPEELKRQFGAGNLEEVYLKAVADPREELTA